MGVDQVWCWVSESCCGLCQNPVVAFKSCSSSLISYQLVKKTFLLWFGECEFNEALGPTNWEEKEDMFVA